MIAILEDDRSIRDLVLYTLNNTGFEAIGFQNSEELYEYLKTSTLSLLLLDIMLPGEDGIQVLKKLRKKENTKSLPIIMLTARDTEFDKIIGLDSGADDYVTKPFSMLELASRIKALLRRTETEEKTTLEYKTLKLDEESHKVYLNNKAVDMTLKEFSTLKLLLSRLGKVISREELLDKVWGYDYIGETRTVDVHIRSIRAKLEDTTYIETVRGVGYRIGGEDD